MLLVAIPALLTVWALAGQPGAFLEHRWRGFSLIWASLGVQIVLFTPLGRGIPHGIVPYAHVATYLPLIAFLILNRRAALGLTAFGISLNVIAITANGGLMPADATAQEVFFAGQSALDHPINTDNVSPNFLLLGDVMALPGWFPFANAFSIGDMVMAMGLVWAMARLTMRRLDRPSVPRERDVPLPAALAAGAGWAAAAIAFALLPVGGLLSLAAVIGTVAIARLLVHAGPLAAALSSPRRRTLAGATVVALGAGLALLDPFAAALTAASGAGVLSTMVGSPFGRAARDGDWGLTSILPVVSIAAGLAAGAIAAGAIAATVALGLAAVTACAGLRARSAAPAEQAVDLAGSRVTEILQLMALAGLGVAAIAGFSVLTERANLSPGGYGLLVAAGVIGGLFGMRMASTLALRATNGAVGLALLFSGAAAGLLMTARLPMTAIAAGVVLGISAGAAWWLVAPGRVRAPAGLTVFAAGMVVAALGGPDVARTSMMVGAAALIVAGVPLILMRTRPIWRIAAGKSA